MCSPRSSDSSRARASSASSGRSSTTIPRSPLRPARARPRIVPAAAWRHPRRIVAAGALVLAVALGAAFYQGTRGSETIEASGSTRARPVLGRARRQRPLGTAPSAVAVGDGSVWVRRCRRQDDLADRSRSRASVERTFSTSSIPTDVAVGDGAVWITNASIDAQSNARRTGCRRASRDSIPSPATSTRRSSSGPHRAGTSSASCRV